jgi:hypothetical protein
MPDATSTLNQIGGALDALANVPMTMINDDRTFMEIWAWNMPAMNRHEFAALIRSPIEPLQRLHGVEINDQDYQDLLRVPTSIAFIQAQVMANLPGGNAFHVYIVVNSLVEKLTNLSKKYVGQSFDLDEIEDKHLLPPKLILELRRISSDIERAKSGVREADTKMQAISAAYDAATNLPSDMSALQSARDGYASMQSVLNDNISTSESARRACEESVVRIQKTEADAQMLLENTKGAFAASTTIGLGKEFYQKADDLAYQVRLLSAGLLVVLVTAGFITFMRINEIHDVIAIKPLSLDLVWANVIAMVASLAAPVWLAWLLTRQLGQRFRLGEDYAFKASVARAYAGYREEASRLKDEVLERKLFEVAIARLSEEPLRHVDRENESTPLKDLIGKIRLKRAPQTSHLGLLAALLEKELKSDSTP